MAFGGFSRGGSGTPMAEINMIPLIDVMLVLLVIFIITAPLLTHSVKVDLPRASSNPNITTPDNVQLAINAEGLVYWNGEVVDRAGLRARMDAASHLKPQPEVHLRADQGVAYRFVAQTLADASKAGLTKIGFVSEPEPSH